MGKVLTVLSVSAFLVFSGVSAFAGQSDMNKEDNQSQNSPAMKGKKGKGSSIESKSSSTTTPNESQEQKGARPGGVGEDDPTTSMFGSPSTLPPSETSPGYTGADKEAEQHEQRQKGM